MTARHNCFYPAKISIVHHFVQKYLDFAFLAPLISAMMVERPAQRLTTEAVLKMFYDIQTELRHTRLRCGLRDRDENVSLTQSCA